MFWIKFDLQSRPKWNAQGKVCVYGGTQVTNSLLLVRIETLQKKEII